MFSAVFIYLFVYYLFIYYLFVCLLFNYLKEAVCCFMHQLCGLAPWGLGKGGGGYFCVLAGELWPNIFSFAFDARQDVMKSLPSFLIYCCYCL